MPEETKTEPLEMWALINACSTERQINPTLIYYDKGQAEHQAKQYVEDREIIPITITEGHGDAFTTDGDCLDSLREWAANVPAVVEPIKGPNFDEALAEAEARVAVTESLLEKYKELSTDQLLSIAKATSQAIQQHDEKVALLAEQEQKLADLYWKLIDSYNNGLCELGDWITELKGNDDWADEGP